MMRILRSSSVEVILDLPGPLRLLSSPVPSFFVMMFQTVDFVSLRFGLCLCFVFSAS
uniref:Uncharacterized protein n=1 Tax=Anguilla anguilla TaxID=7936 RepID=A0A0E9WGS9_ANGAN